MEGGKEAERKKGRNEERGERKRGRERLTHPHT